MRSKGLKGWWSGFQDWVEVASPAAKLDAARRYRDHRTP
jgi:hypothetical protein